MSDDGSSASTVLNTIVAALEGLDEVTRSRVLKAVSSFYDLGPSTRNDPTTSASNSSNSTLPKFSTHEALSPKEFLAQKQPRTDVERIACLAYYLTHYRQTDHFKTLDLAKLNTEAAHPKFSNAAYAANNATNAGYLAPAQSGYRQISAAGEQYVHTLPDRDAAKAIMSQIRRRKTPSRKK